MFKKLLLATALVIGMSANARAEDPTKRYVEIFLVWADGTQQSFTPSCGGQNMAFYMIGDCLVLKDMCNNRTWMFSHVWKYIDAKEVAPQ